MKISKDTNMRLCQALCKPITELRLQINKEERGATDLELAQLWLKQHEQIVVALKLTRHQLSP